MKPDKQIIYSSFKLAEFILSCVNIEFYLDLTTSFALLHILCPKFLHYCIVYLMYIVCLKFSCCWCDFLYTYFWSTVRESLWQKNFIASSRFHVIVVHMRSKSWNLEMLPRVDTLFSASGRYRLCPNFPISPTRCCKSEADVNSFTHSAAILYIYANFCSSSSSL